MDDELIDDVFEEERNYFQNTDTGLNVNEATFLDDHTPSPTDRHPAFRNVNLKSSGGVDDGWNSFKIDDDNNGFDENLLHKVNCLIVCLSYGTNPLFTS